MMAESNVESLDNRRHHDKYVPPHGMTMMRPGPYGVQEFLAADDEGNMRPVGHCLTIECGKFNLLHNISMRGHIISFLYVLCCYVHIAYLTHTPYREGL